MLGVFSKRSLGFHFLLVNKRLLWLLWWSLWLCSINYFRSCSWRWVSSLLLWKALYGGYGHFSSFLNWVMWGTLIGCSLVSIMYLHSFFSKTLQSIFISKIVKYILLIMYFYLCLINIIYYNIYHYLIMICNNVFTMYFQIYTYINKYWIN